jgi:hypothetical protein
VAALVLGVAQAGAAQAATLTVTDTGTLGTGFEVPLSVAAFDPSLGTLTAVAWSLVIDWSATVTFRNPDTVVQTVGLGSTGTYFDIFVVDESAGLSGLYGFRALAFDYLYVEDGREFSPTLAGGESRSTTIPLQTFSFAGSTQAPIGLGAGTPTDWTAPVGLTIIPSLTTSAQFGFDLDASGNLVPTGLPLETRFTEDLTATLSVIYTYDPVTSGGGGPDDPVDPVPVVPLPAGLPLMLGGLAALAVVRRRRGA